MTSSPQFITDQFIRDECAALKVDCYWCLDRGDSPFCDCVADSEYAECDACEAGRPDLCFCDEE